jgi:predicted transcriptional regulator
MDVLSSEISRAAILPLFPAVGRDINYTAAAIYGAIVYLVMETGRESVVIDRYAIAELVGIGKTQVSKYLWRLVDKGWLEKEETEEWRPLRWKRT